MPKQAWSSAKTKRFSRNRQKLAVLRCDEVVNATLVCFDRFFLWPPPSACLPICLRPGERGAPNKMEGKRQVMPPHAALVCSTHTSFCWRPHLETIVLLGMKRPIFAVAGIFEALRLVLLGPLIAMAASKMGPAYHGDFWGLLSRWLLRPFFRQSDASATLMSLLPRRWPQ